MAFGRYDDLPQLVREYLNYLLTIKGRSARTVDGYAVDLRAFLRFMSCHKKLTPDSVVSDQFDLTQLPAAFFQTITLADIYEFLYYTMDQRQNSAKTRARKASTLRGFFKYLTTNTQLLKENPIRDLEMPSVKKSMPIYMNLNQSVQLLETLAQSDSATQYRDYCMITLFLNCGMRLSELVGIDLHHINQQTGQLKLLGKGNKERMVYLNDACQSAIDNYLTIERPKLKQIIDKQALFLSSRTGRRLGTRQVEKIVSQAIRKAGLDGQGFTTHKLRHTAATLMYQEGHVDLLVLKELLGHESIGTTEIYTHVADAKVQEAVKKNPLSDIKKK